MNKVSHRRRIFDIAYIMLNTYYKNWFEDVYNIRTAQEDLNRISGLWIVGFQRTCWDSVDIFNRNDSFLFVD